MVPEPSSAAIRRIETAANPSESAIADERVEEYLSNLIGSADRSLEEAAGRLAGARGIL